ncbi:uncharacterized protein TNCV_3799381 [Trichonephila clavipes]|nr:uncharacterized protein TNCV_3799381 [Trichonephila clavipes]
MALGGSLPQINLGVQGLFSITHLYYEDYPSVRSIFQATWICFFQRVLSIGPSLIHRLPPLQFRLRLGTIGVIADIKQTFLQICVGAEDRNVLRFLWLEDAKLDKFTSVNDIKELGQLKSQSLQVMNEASFELRSWAHTGVKYQESQSVLGLKWDTDTDELYCVGPQVDMESTEVVTNRKLHLIVSSIYDPTGFTSPVTLLPKLLLQESWRNELDWDAELISELQSRYRRWVKQLDLVEKCRIPRRISGRSESLNGFRKAKIAPVKRPTIPSMKLLGAVMGARINLTTSESLHVSLKTYFWTDSLIVLAWIKNRKPWNTFVGNRMMEIKELTNVDYWRHVPGDVNPADLPSRSCEWSDPLQSQWWEDPAWIKETENNWQMLTLQCLMKL